MKIINDRYKIIESLYSDFFVEAYKVVDKEDDNTPKFLKLYHFNLQQDFIDYLIEHQFRINDIKHKNLIQSESFDIVKRADGRETSSLMYFSVSEFAKTMPIVQRINFLNFNDRLKIFLDILMLIDYLHFRGFKYKFLTPAQICICDNNEIKLQSVYTIIEKTFSSEYSEFERRFISPDFITKNIVDLRSLDYFSLSKMIEYLFLDEADIIVDSGLDIDSEKVIAFFNHLIKDLENKDFRIKDINLINYVDEIIEFFNVDYPYDLVSERDHLYLDSPTVVRKKAIAKLLTFDENFDKEIVSSNVILVSGDEGMSKSRFLREIEYKLHLRNKNVFVFDVKDNKESELKALDKFLKQMLKDSPASLKDKYQDEFSLKSHLPKLKDSVEYEKEYYSKKYRFYNRVTNFLKEYSESKTTYILINNVQNSSEGFLSFLDYLAENLNNSKTVCVFAYDIDMLIKNPQFKLMSDKWEKQLTAMNIELTSFSVEEAAELVKNTLGIGEIDERYARYLLEESNGRPEKIIDTLKFLHDQGYLYMQTDGEWHLDLKDSSQLYVPSIEDSKTVEQLMSVNANYFETIKVLSFFSGNVPKSVLSRLCVLDEKLESILKYLIEAKIINKVKADTQNAYSINNVQFKKRVYSDISQAEKLEIHKQIADILYEDKTYYSDSMFDEMIDQLLKSKQYEKAIISVISRLEVIENKSGTKARSLLEKVYNVLSEINDTEKKLDISQKLLYIDLLKGDLKLNDKRLKEYTDLATSVNAKNHIMHSMMFIAEMYYQKDDKTLFIEQIENMQKLNEDYNLAEFEAYCLTVMSNISLANSELETAQKDLNQALDIAYKNNLKDQLGNIYNMLGIVDFLNGHHASAIANFEKSYEYFEIDRDVMRSVKPINNLGNLHVAFFNDLDKAVLTYKKGLALAKQYDLKKIQIIFYINLSGVMQEKYEYDKALQYAMEANKIAVKMQDNHKVAICQNLMGAIYLEQEEYGKAYNCFNYDRDLYSQIKVSDIQLSLAYYIFSAGFKLSFGQWDDAIKYYSKAKDIYKKIDIRQYYKIKLKLFMNEFLNKGHFDKVELEEFLTIYKSTIYTENYREALLTIALLSTEIKDLDYTNDLLSRDLLVKDKADLDYLNRLRSQVIFLTQLNAENLKRSIIEYRNDISKHQTPFKAMFLENIANLCSEEKLYDEAIRHYIEALEIIYKNLIKIPEWDLKISYLKSRNTDNIKTKLAGVLKSKYNFTMKSTPISSFSEKEDYAQLNKYFNFTSIFNSLGKDEFSKVTQIHTYGDALSINSIEDLMKMFNSDYDYNLNLMINYIAKEAFASDACIIKYGDRNSSFEGVASINNKNEINKNINDGIIKLATRTPGGLLASFDLDNYNRNLDNQLIADDMTAMICVPVHSNNTLLLHGEYRRQSSNSFESVSAYIYLETNRVFNNFTQETLDLINSVAYLIHQNIEMKKLTLLATTDKLTGAYTRKYYDEQFSDLIEKSKAVGNSFSVLMLDLDKFKNINDNYGHQKGDIVLREVSRRIKSSIRNSDIFARYGGEEFIIILKNTNVKEARLVGEKIRKNVAALKIDGIDNSFTVSIGISLYPNHSKFKDDLVKKADQALYHAKQSGRNKVSLYNSEMEGVFDRTDILAGILTGVNEIDSKNILGIVKLSQLVEQTISVEDKISTYLGEIISQITAEFATLIIFKDGKREYYTRYMTKDTFTSTPGLSEKVINRVKINKNGEYSIDWDSVDDIDPISKAPNWNSIIVVPMIKGGEVVGITYLSVPLSFKEFNFNDFNLTRAFATLFTAIL